MECSSDSGNSTFPTDFQYQFHTEDCAFYKTTLSQSLDEVNDCCLNELQQYGDIHAIIKDLEANILHLVANQIQTVHSLLLDIASVIGEMDILLSWSSLCDDCNFIRPVITNESIIQVTVVY